MRSTFSYCQEHLKHFLENCQFYQKSGNGAYNTRWGSCYLHYYDVLRTKMDM